MLRKTIKRAFLLFLALFFLFESWLWNEAGRWVAWVVRALPLDSLKSFIIRSVQGLSPLATLGVFLIPALLLLPLKLMAVWLLAKGHVAGGIGVVLLAKTLGLGISSFLFALCKEKLLQLHWVRWVYELCLSLYNKAHHITAPYKAAVRRQMAALRAMLPRGMMQRRFSRMRRHIRRRGGKQP